MQLYSLDRIFKILHKLQCTNVFHIIFQPTTIIFRIHIAFYRCTMNICLPIFTYLRVIRNARIEKSHK